MLGETQQSVELSELEIKNILLVDDDDELTDTLKLLLEAHNYLVTVVRNGVEALKEIMEFDFDIIICDMFMPAMAGDMFYRAVERTRPKLCERFIFVTGHQGNPHIDQFIKSVNGVVLNKPFKSQDLIEVISLVLKQTEQRPSV